MPNNQNPPFGADTNDPAWGDWWLRFNKLLSDVSTSVANIDDVTITGVGDGEVLVNSSGVWINNTLAEADIAAASRTLTAGVGLSGGGDLTADRTFDLDIESLTVEATITEASDLVPYFNTADEAVQAVTVDDLIAEGLTEGDGVSIGANNTLAMDIEGLTTENVSQNTETDFLAYFNVADEAVQKIIVDDLITAGGAESFDIEASTTENTVNPETDFISYFNVADEANQKVLVEELIKWELIASGTFSETASLEVTDIDEAGYSSIHLVMANTAPDTDAQGLRLQMSADNGATWDTTGSNYRTVTAGGDVGDTSMTVFTSSSSASMFNSVVSNPGNQANETFGADITLLDISATEYTHSIFFGGGTLAGGIHEFFQGSCSHNSAAAQNAFRFLFVSGNIEVGNYWIYGRRG